MLRPPHGAPGMLAVAADSGRITIRNAVTSGWPAWIWPAVLIAPGFLFFAALYGIMNPPELKWMAWFWVAYAGFFLLAVWLGNIASIEIDPSKIAVRRPIRSQQARMDDVLRVDARKMPWKYATRYRPAPYIIDVWLGGYRHWRLQYVEPEAGDRLLAILHGYHKPVWIVRTA